jgi:hypothetical protein
VGVLLVVGEELAGGGVLFALPGQGGLERTGSTGRTTIGGERRGLELADVFGEGGDAGLAVALLAREAAVLGLVFAELALEVVPLRAQGGEGGVEVLDLLVLEGERVGELLLGVGEVGPEPLGELVGQLEALARVGELLEGEGVGALLGRQLLPHHLQLAEGGPVLLLLVLQQVQHLVIERLQVLQLRQHLPQRLLPHSLLLLIIGAGARSSGLGAQGVELLLQPRLLFAGAAPAITHGEPR